MDEFEDENASYTRRQINLLRGRRVDQLSPKEKLEFADYAPRPLPATNRTDDKHRFDIDVAKLEGVQPLTKLQVANGAPVMSEIRSKSARITSELSSTTDPYQRRALEIRLEQLRHEGMILYAKIGPFEKKSA